LTTVLDAPGRRLLAALLSFAAGADLLAGRSLCAGLLRNALLLLVLLLLLLVGLMGTRMPICTVKSRPETCFSNLPGRCTGTWR
jgi:hypothetical protein